MAEVNERFNPNEVKELDEIIRSSYNIFVRLERRNLLLVSAIAVISAYSGLNPSKGTLFGFSFENLTPSAFYLILTVLTLYFLVAFLIYSVPNFRDATQARKNILSESGALEYEKPWYSIVPPNIDTDARYFSWVFVHFILPVLSGLMSIAIGVSKIA